MCIKAQLCQEEHKLSIECSKNLTVAAGNPKKICRRTKAAKPVVFLCWSGAVYSCLAHWTCACWLMCNRLTRLNELWQLLSRSCLREHILIIAIAVTDYHCRRQIQSLVLNALPSLICLGSYVLIRFCHDSMVTFKKFSTQRRHTWASDCKAKIQVRVDLQPIQSFPIAIWWDPRARFTPVTVAPPVLICTNVCKAPIT